MLMQTIGKLSKDQMADWPKHLPELVHAYNFTRSAIMEYSPHYLMFVWQPHLPIDFYFPTIMSTDKHQHVNQYIADLHEQVHKAFKEAQAQSTSEAERQKWYYDYKPNAISLEPGGLVCAKADAYKGKRKVKDKWEEEPYKVECSIAEGNLPTLWRISGLDAHKSSPSESTLSHHPYNGSSFMFRYMSWVDKVHHYLPGGTYPESEWEWGSATKCKVSTTSPVLDRWDYTRAGQWGAPHIPENVFQSLLARPRVKSLMWREGDMWASMSAFQRKKCLTYWWS